ncbi:MAG: murein biosynthesis integral membrane protein MurJ [candidate division WOR-3 bacterium]
MKGIKGFIAGTLVSRVLGLVREATIAYLLGARDAADAFYAAMRIPMLLRDMVAENVVQTAFIPSFIEARDRFRNQESFLSTIVLLLGTVVSALTLIGIILAPWLVKLITWGFPPEKMALTIDLTRLIFPLIILVSASAIASGLLNTKRNFFVPALSPALLNLGTVALAAGAALWCRDMTSRAIVLTLGTLVGGALQVVFQFPFLRGFRMKRPDFRHPSIKSFGRLLVPVLVSTGFSRLTLLVNTLIASFLGTGAVAYLNYAFRIMQLPLGLFGVGVATVVLPAMAERAARDTQPNEDLSSGEVASFFFIAPATVFIIMVAQPIIHILFGRGNFGILDSFYSAQALILYTLGVPGISLSRVYLNYMFALKKTRDPNTSFFLSAGTNIALSLALAPLMGFAGLALATGISGWVQAAYLRWRTPLGSEWTGKLLMILGIAGVSYIPVWFLVTRMNPWLSVSIELVVGTGIYLGLTHLAGLEFTRKLFRRG